MANKAYIKRLRAVAIKAVCRHCGQPRSSHGDKVKGVSVCLTLNRRTHNGDPKYVQITKKETYFE